MRFSRLSRAVAAAGVVLGLAGVPALANQPQTVPSSMAAVGDSITRGFNACGWFFDCTSRSWTTGTYNSVNSHFERLQAISPTMTAAYNEGRTGAKMAEAATQAQDAVNRGAGYVTFLLGANDACTDTEAQMTSVADYEAQFRAAMATLDPDNSGRLVFVSSVPDVKRLWEIGKDSRSARNAWSGYGICQSMLANPTSTKKADADRRDRVQQRVIDFNNVLATVCAEYVNCDFDDNAVFNYPFQLSHMSTWDYFHPNTTGQGILADVTFSAGWTWQ